MVTRLSFASLCLAAFLLLALPSKVTKPASLTAPAVQSSQAKLAGSQLAAQYAQIPLAFERNQGQTDARVKFLSRGHGYTVFLTSDEAVLEFRKPAAVPSFAAPRSTGNLQTGVVHMKLVNASAEPAIAALDQLPGISNYFVGRDPRGWHSGVANFARVKYRNVYPGVDLVYYGNQGQLEYDFVLQPGANPEEIRLELLGLDQTGEQHAPLLDATGAVIAETSAGDVRLHKPVIYQRTQSGDTRQIDGHYRLLADHHLGFEVSAYDKTRELVIDPVLTYASYLGGSGADAHDSVSVTSDSSGNTYVASGTMSADFPVTAGAYQGGYAGGPGICNQGDSFCGDAFVTKINPSGTAIIYSTYLGGTDSDYAYGLAVDGSGNAYVTGLTRSTDFPITAGAFQPVFGGAPATCDDYVCGDVFVTKLNATGSALVYSSYLGGSNNEHAEAITIDGLGDAYVTGDTGSTNFPITPGAFQTQFTGTDTCAGISGATEACHVAFLSKVNPTGIQLVYSTYLGGSSGDGGGGVVVDRSGRASVSGGACSSNFPVTANAFQKVAGGGCDIFVSTFNATGSKLLYSTYLGGSGYESSFSTAIDSAGNVYVSALSYSADFPVTAGAAQGALAGNDDAIVAKINPFSSGAASLVFSTYLGGSGSDIAAGIAVDSQGNAYVTGQTMSSDFPVVNPIQAALNGQADAFVTEVNPQGSGFVYSTYLGGSGTELADFIAVDSAGNSYVAGWTQSADFPSTPRSFQPSYGGGTTDVFVAKIGPNAGAGLSFTPATLTFGPQAVGTTSPAQTVIVHDMGSAALVISSISASASFAETNNCGASVIGGGSCAISVTFTPSSVGLRNGTVGVADNAGGSPQKIKLTGTGK
ncbi:MAG TPA: SBBP repeat-containing protein [Candidatus Sulfotelmatobacter sp.]|nr:SBBP repeat-containing protein [Candidatus Sulfotelmatobacter sp.]